jgi:hypothetical protein
MIETVILMSLLQTFEIDVLEKPVEVAEHRLLSGRVFQYKVQSWDDLETLTH